MANQYQTGMSAAYIERRATLWRIRREYPAAAMQREAIIMGSPPPPDGMPGGTQITDPTADKAARLAALDGFVIAVESSLLIVPEVYRAGVWRHVLTGERFPKNADRSTYERWERRYLRAVAGRIY